MYRIIAALATAVVTASAGLIYGGVQKRKSSNLEKQKHELQQEKDNKEEQIKQQEIEKQKAEEKIKEQDELIRQHEEEINQQKKKEQIIDDFDIDKYDDIEYMEDL